MKKLLLSLPLLVPGFALAQESAVQFGYISSLVTSVGGILNLLLPIVVTLAVLFFFWGLALFVLNAGDEEARSRGRNIMVWGVIALFIIVAVWGLVELLATILGVGTGGSANVPGVVSTTDPTPILNRE